MTEQTIRTVPFDEEIRDFTSDRKPLKFKIDNDIFEAPANIPAQILLDFSRRYEAMGEQAETGTYIEATQDLIAMVLKPSSVERFKARLSDIENPISLDQLNSILTWLMEEYTGRPTESSEGSSNGQPSPESGTSSTDDTPPSTSEPSL
jgi:hypothetical protein